MSSKSRTKSPAASPKPCASLSLRKKKKPSPTSPPKILQAYDYFLRGRNYARRANLEFAMQMFEHAIKLDPNFALAHAGIANVCGMQAELHGRDARGSKKAWPPPIAPSSCNPHLPEALAARARIHSRPTEIRRSHPLARIAIERKPDCENAYSVLGSALFSSDRWEEAISLMDRALAAAGRRLQRLHSLRQRAIAPSAKPKPPELCAKTIPRSRASPGNRPRRRPRQNSPSHQLRPCSAKAKKPAATRESRSHAPLGFPNALQRSLHLRRPKYETRSPSHLPLGHRSRLQKCPMGRPRQRPSLPPQRPRIRAIAQRAATKKLVCPQEDLALRLSCSHAQR